MKNEKGLTPSQKRVQKQQVKKAHQLEKKARLLNRPDFQTSPRTPQNFSISAGSPRVGVNPDSIMSYLMEWSHLEADIDGSWSWGQPRLWDESDWDNTIHPNLSEFQKLTWADIYEQKTVGRRNKIKKKHHDMNVCDICPEACKRWNEDLELDEYEKVFRFRLGNLPRLWGYRIFTKFIIVWWDKYHKICPSD